MISSRSFKIVFTAGNLFYVDKNRVQNEKFFISFKNWGHMYTNSPVKMIVVRKCITDGNWQIIRR